MWDLVCHCIPRKDDSSQPSFADPRFRTTGLLGIFTPTTLHLWDFRLCFVLFSPCLLSLAGWSHLFQLIRWDEHHQRHCGGAAGLSRTRRD